MSLLLIPTQVKEVSSIFELSHHDRKLQSKPRVTVFDLAKEVYKNIAGPLVAPGILPPQ